LNGQPVGNHSGGHLPFDFPITDLLNFSEENRLTVAVNNTLTPDSIPQGNYVWHNESNTYPPGDGKEFCS
jgi:beta-glucuronidase